MFPDDDVIGLPWVNSSLLNILFFIPGKYIGIQLMAVKLFTNQPRSIAISSIIAEHQASRGQAQFKWKIFKSSMQIN